MFSGTSIVPRCSPSGEITQRPFGPGHPDVAELVDLHPVRDALLDHAGADALEEHAAVRERAVGVDVVDLDVGARGVVDVQQLLVGREAEPVRHLELVLGDGEVELVLAAARGDPEDALPAELARALDAEAGEAAVPRVGEVDRPVGADGDVVRAVQVLALPVEGERLADAVGALADERARDVLADEQVEIGVEHHPVALERGVPDLGDGAVERDLAANVRRHVGEVEDLLDGVPDRALRERESRRELLDTRALFDEVVDRVRFRVDSGHCVVPFRDGGCRRDANTTPILYAVPSGDELSPRHGRVHPGLERGGEPPGRPRGARRRCCPTCDVLVIDDGSTDATAEVARDGGRDRRLVRGEPRPARRNRRRLSRGRRARLRVLRPRRRRRPASGRRARAAARARPLGRLRRRRRVALRGRRGVRRRALPAVAEPALRDRPAAEGDARAPRPAASTTRRAAWPRSTPRRCP